MRYFKFQDFNSLRNILEEKSPLTFIYDKEIFIRVLNTMKTGDNQLIFADLQIIRLWCRKMTAEINRHFDLRIVPQKIPQVKIEISNRCAQLAKIVSTFFQIPQLLTISIATCHDLLVLGQLPATREIVNTIFPLLTYNETKIPFLHIISRANYQVDGLPLWDPSLVLLHPQLHKSLLEISPPQSREEIDDALALYHNLEAINRGDQAITLNERKYIPYLDLDSVLQNVPSEILADFPDDSIRSSFFKYALHRCNASNINFTIPFLDILCCKSIFDPSVKDIALQILAVQLPELLKLPLTPKQVAHLQCLEMKENSSFFTMITDALDKQDNFSLACGWIRFLYSNTEWIRKEAYQIMLDILQGASPPDVFKIPDKDYFVETFRQNLLKGKSNNESLNSQGVSTLVDTILSDAQKLDIRQIVGKKLANLILNPFIDVTDAISRLSNLPFIEFPELLHAISVRDPSFIRKFNSCERLFELIGAMNKNPDTCLHLVPILTRVAFFPLIPECPSSNIDNSDSKIESLTKTKLDTGDKSYSEYNFNPELDDSISNIISKSKTISEECDVSYGVNGCLLRFPKFVSDRYTIQGNSGYFQPEFYEPIEDFPLQPIISDWISFKKSLKEKKGKAIVPIQKGIGLPMLISVLLCNSDYCNGLLDQLESDSLIASKFVTLGEPNQVLLALIYSVLGANRTTPIVTQICSSLLPKDINNGLKLAQIIIELNGQFDIPSEINNYLEELTTRRAALSYLVARLEKHLPIDGVDFDLIERFMDQILSGDENMISLSLLRLIETVLTQNAPIKTAEKMWHLGDSFVKMMAFHLMSPTKPENISAALVTASNEKDTPCLRSAATELLCAGALNHSYDHTISALFSTDPVPTLFTFQLLRLLSIPSVKALVPHFIDFVKPFLSLNLGERKSKSGKDEEENQNEANNKTLTNQNSNKQNDNIKKDNNNNDNKNELVIYTKAALYCLLRTDFVDPEIAVLMTHLVQYEELTETVLQILASFSDKTIKLFDSSMISEICKILHFSETKTLKIGLICINHLINAGIAFPSESMLSLLEIYESYVTSNISSSTLHYVFHQIFCTSSIPIPPNSNPLNPKIKEIALEHGFLECSLKEVRLLGNYPDQLDLIFETVASFLNEFEDGQNYLYDVWGNEILIKSYNSRNAFLRFLLCYSARNPKIQSSFTSIGKEDSLLLHLLSDFDLKGETNPLLIQLIASLLNSESIRKVIYRTNKLQPLVSRLQTALVLKAKQWQLVNEILRVLVTLTFYPDGNDELYNKVKVIDLLCDLSTRPEITESQLFNIFMNNLKGHQKTWIGLKGAINRDDEGLPDRLNKWLS